MNQIIGFAPDADPLAPGVLTDCENVVPTYHGLAGAPSLVEAVSGLPALAAQCRGAAVLTDTDGTRRTFAGTQTDMYELTGVTWTDVSRVANYTGSPDSRWIFAQFGNIAIATDNGAPIQASASGVFADIATAPSAKVVFATKDFLIALATNDGTFGNLPDGWWCSAFQDHSSWTPSVATQATRGRLVGGGGGFMAGLALGSYAVAYKARAMFLGTYAEGSPIVWQWQQIPGEVGCVGPDAIADLGGVHFFVGEDNIWLFDGTRPIPIGDGTVRQWFFDTADPFSLTHAVVRYDRHNDLVWLFFSAGGAGIDSALVYATKTKRWSRANQTIEAALNFLSPGITWDTIETVALTWETLPNISWDSPFWDAGAASFAVFNTAHQLRALTGASTGGSITTGDVGGSTNTSMLVSSKLGFVQAPSSATATASSKASQGLTLVSGTTSPFAEGKFCHRQTARYHRIRYDMVGPFEVDTHQADLMSRGRR